MSDLLPCPFCGSNNVHVADLAGFESFCKECGASGPLRADGSNTEFYDKETVTKYWNRRTETAGLIQEIKEVTNDKARLLKALKCLHGQVKADRERVFLASLDETNAAEIIAEIEAKG